MTTSADWTIEQLRALNIPDGLLDSVERLAMERDRFRDALAFEARHTDDDEARGRMALAAVGRWGLAYGHVPMAAWLEAMSDAHRLIASSRAPTVAGRRIRRTLVRS